MSRDSVKYIKRMLSRGSVIRKVVFWLDSVCWILGDVLLYIAKWMRRIRSALKIKPDENTREKAHGNS